MSKRGGEIIKDPIKKFKLEEIKDLTDIRSTLEKFKRLRRLHLKHWILKKETLKIIGTKKTLVHLTLLDCQIENDDLPLLITELENLEYLEISGNWNIENSLNGISKKCKKLKQLKLRKYPMSYSSVFEEILQLYNLECLVICDVENVDDNYIIQITKNLKKLKTLEFGCCDNFTNDTLQQLGQLKELEHLLLSSAHNDESIISITNNCNKLKSLRLFHCTGTSSALCELEKLKYLETLHLYDIENVNDDVIICIANQCKNLKTLKINFSLKLTEIGLKEIEKLENLECLELKHIKNITDVVFNKKYKLKTFKCFDSTKFTDQGLKKLLKNCQSLETLIINSAVFTNQVLLCAIEETKKRTNNILLTIIDMGKCHIKVGSNINSTPLLEIIHKFV
ncbi:hypothetical protein HCN44_005078 [Aphidius gifuensis]|uniref:Uncharacterized protein n=1 Tax=Aphidius gifuensis TaxID=684658 RepID=A0A835CRE0_APHGI|nr:hypothetical protein HCN44_005078 [Aphidius gifuensis]